MTPAYLLKDYRTLSYYSGTFTFFSLIAILAICSYAIVVIRDNKQMSKEPIIKQFDLAAFPLFMGQSIVLFEMNVSLLNVYAEHRHPREMFSSTIKTHIITVVLACLVGWLSYYAFGDKVQSIVLYDLP